MKKFILIFCLLASINLAFAQPDIQEKYAAHINTTYLNKHLSIIAGAEMEGRETGTEGQRKAAAYIESQFKAMGLKTVPALKGYQQFYPLYQDSLHRGELEISGADAVFGTDFIIPMNNNETGKFKAKSIVFAGYGIDTDKYSDYEGLDVKGKVVVIFLGEPKKDGSYFLGESNRYSEWTFPGIPKKLEAAQAKGAAGVFIINPRQSTFSERSVSSGRKTGVYYPSEESGAKKLNFAQLSHDFAKTILGDNFDALLAKVKENAVFDKTTAAVINSKVEFELKKHREVIKASNVVGIIEGTDKKDEYVFLTAHYDHLGKRNGLIYYGADDDGSGTVAVMNMAEAFSKAAAAGHKPRRTMVFMAVSGEEKGLWGSQYYSEHPFYPLEKTTVDLNIDMVGRVDTERITDDSLNYVYVVGHDKLSSELPLVNEGMNNKYSKLVLDYKFDDPKDPNRIYFRSDHYNFARKGVPVLFFYDGMLKSDYHKPTDTVDKINWALFEKRSKMIFHTAWEMANRNEMLKRDTPLNMGSR